MDPNKYSAQGTVSKPISAPQMLTLLPLGQDSSDPLVQRSLLLSAFTPQAASHPVPATYVAAPSNASMVLTSDGNQISAVDTIAYQPVASGVPAGSGPAGMVFSADGSTLYVANSGDGTVSVISVAATGSAPQYTFTSQATVTVGGVAAAAGALAGRAVPLRQHRQRQPRTVSSLSSPPAPSPAVHSTLDVGLAPRGVACTPSGAQIFVANSGSNTVTVVGRAPNGVHSVVGSITNLTGASDVVVSLDGAVLLVACPGANAVVAVDAVHPEAPRQSLPTGTGAQSLDLMPTGAYAVVTNSGASTVSLISIGARPTQCQVLTSTQVTGSPTGVAVTPDAGLVLVGTGSTLSVITLATYASAQTFPSIGGQPTDVAVSPDNSTVIGWHNALVTISRGKPSTGLFCYDVASQTVTPQLTDSQVVDFVYQPSASAKTAFLVTQGATTVEVYSTDGWTAPAASRCKAAASRSRWAARPTAARCSCSRSARDQSAILAGFDLTSSSDYPVLGTLCRPRGRRQPGLDVDPGGRAGRLGGVPDRPGQRPAHPGQAGLTTAATRSPATRSRSASYPGASAVIAGRHRAVRGLRRPLNGTVVRVDTASLDAGFGGAAVQLVHRTGLAAGVAGRQPDLRGGPGDGRRPGAGRGLAAADPDAELASGVEMPNGIAVASDGSAVYTANIVSGNLGMLSQVQASWSDLQAEPGVTEESTFRAGEVPRELGDSPAYQGLFIRDYVGQTPSSGNATGAWTTCPDIWASGQSLITDPNPTLVPATTPRRRRPTPSTSPAPGRTTGLRARAEHGERREHLAGLALLRQRRRRPVAHAAGRTAG